MARSKIPSLFFFTLITLSLLVTLPSFVEHAEATDYDIFEITNASGNLYLTYVWDNYLYVHNDTYILKYTLVTKTLTDQIDLGASTVVNELIGRGDFIYLQVTEIATEKVVAIDLINFIEADRIAETSLTNWNGDIKNLAYLLDSAIDYWAWTEITGAEILVESNNLMTMSASSEPQPQYPRFIALATCYHGTYVDTVYMWAHIWNGTGVESDYTTISIPQHSSVTGYIEWNLAPSIAQKGQYQHPMGSWHRFGYNVNAFTDTQGRFEAYGGWNAVYASFDTAGIHSQDSGTFKHVMNSEVNNKYYYDYDTAEHHIRFRSDIKDEFVFASFYTEDIYPYDSTYGSPLTVDIAQDADFDRAHTEGLIAGIETLDWRGSNSLFIAWVQDQNQTPIVYRIMGGGSEYQQQVGVLPPEYNPTDTMLWANRVGDFDDYQDDSIVAIWTEDADTSLYVCVNLIEGQYMRYGETENIVAQLYKHYPLTTVDNFRLDTRWMVDNDDYIRVINTRVYLYVDDVYLSSYWTNGYGIIQMNVAPSNYPITYSYYMNKTGFNDQWLNVTIYDYTTFSADSTITEQPLLLLGFQDNRESENMRVTLNVLRYTGEDFNAGWFGNVPTVHVYVETYAGDSLDSVIDVGILDANANGEIKFVLSYTEPYGYIGKHYFRVSEQHTSIGNFTENAQIQFAYDASTGNVTEGEYVSLPSTPTQTEYYPTGDEAINPTTIEQFAVVWTGNAGFLMALGFITAITIGFAKISPDSAVFGVITLVGMTIGFLGYTGLLPFPIFVVVLLVIVLGITVIFTGLLTGGRVNKNE